MTISSTNRKAGPFIGNGSASVFAFSFRVFAASDLEVVRITVATGVETTLTINSAYTVSLNADQNSNPGGSITLTGGALASGYNLIITSDIANLQPTDLTNQGGFYPEVITGALDRATIQIQQLDEHVSRTLSYPITDPFVGTELPPLEQRKGTVLAFDETTGAPEAGPSVGAILTVSGNIAGINTVATNIASVNTAAGSIASVNTVAGSIGSVNTVSGINASVTAVAAINNKVVIAADNVADINNFADVYQGGKASNPTLRNDGTALQTGDLYFNTTNDRMRVYEVGTGWIDYEATAQAAATTATTQAGIATTQATAATTARTGAETARDAAFVNANVYANTTAGLAAVALNEQFQVVSGDEIIRYREDAGPVATEVARYPSYEYVEDIYRERILASKANFFVKSVERTNYAKRAAILVMVGQSNNVPRGTPISGSVSSDVLMPVGGNSMTYWPYNAVNAEWVAQYADVASAVTDAQGASENPGSGMALAMLGGTFSRVYMCSVALGSSSFTRLQSTGLIHNCYAVINRLCDIARADGFEPYVVFDTHHGETAAANGDSEATYYSQGWKYYRQIQAFAANAMDRRDYDAPIVFHMPIAYGTFGTAANMRNVARAIVRLARDIPGGILLGGSYQFLASDGVHHTNIAVRQKGEYGGMLARDYFAKADTAQCLQMVDAVWGGTTVTVTFNEEITYDTGLTFGTSLNTANALGGFEFFDDATPIKVNSIAVQGRKAVLTLNATPTGTTQTVQIASQAMTGTPSTFPTVAGSQVRTTSTSPVGIYDHTKTYYDLAAPQTIEARP